MERKKSVIFFDTDMDTDCDDMGALAIVCEYARRKQIELLGIVCDSINAYGASCCDAVCSFYGVKVPVGTLYSDEKTENGRLSAYRAHHTRTGAVGRDYTKRLAEQGGTAQRSYPSAVETYRKALARAEDGTVTVVCTGLLTALYELLCSEADTHSSLTGVRLVERKVQKIVCMGFPAKEGSNFNWSMDGESAEGFFKLCPVPVYVSGEGTDIITGTTLSATLPATHPLRVAYEQWLGGEGRGRASWDLIAVAFAIEPNGKLFKAVERGTCRFDKEPPRSYFEKGERQDFEIVCAATKAECAAELEKRMTGRFCEN